MRKLGSGSRNYLEKMGALKTTSLTYAAATLTITIISACMKRVLETIIGWKHQVYLKVISQTSNYLATT